MSYKILSLDGGGSWALIQARILQDIYGDIRGHELLRQFDLAIANSGGSLVLASLCNDMKLSEIIAVFETKAHREKVFSALTFWEKLKGRNVASLVSKLTDIGPRYDTGRKVKGLIQVLKQYDHLLAEDMVDKPIIETPLHELPAIIGKPDLQIVIVGFDYFRERVSFFRSNPLSATDKFNGGKYYQVSLAHAIHASSNAPVNYFDAPAEVHIGLLNGKDNRKTWYWDGAVAGFNNPVLAGLTEAITNNPTTPLNDYCILSIGTGTGSRAILADYQYSSDPDVKAIYDKNKDNPLAFTDSTFNYLKDVNKMATSILSDPPDSATFIAYTILDPTLSNKVNLIRINPCIRPEKDANNWYDLPQVYKNDAKGNEKFKALLDMDMDAVADNEVALISDLCDKFIVTDGSPCLTNQLIRGTILSDQTVPILGQRNYKEAREKWLAAIKTQMLVVG